MSAPRRSGRASAGLAAALAAVTSAAGSAWAHDLTVRITGVRGGDGAIVADLWQGPDGFRDTARAVRSGTVPARDGAVEITFQGLEAGRYAVIAYHDEDGDGEMDRFFGMMPTEGWGLSNDPDVGGPPDFEPAAFELPAAGPVIKIPLNY